MNKDTTRPIYFQLGKCKYKAYDSHVDYETKIIAKLTDFTAINNLKKIENMIKPNEPELVSDFRIINKSDKISLYIEQDTSKILTQLMDEYYQDKDKDSIPFTSYGKYIFTIELVRNKQMFECVPRLHTFMFYNN